VYARAISVVISFPMTDRSSMVTELAHGGLRTDRERANGEIIDASSY
jgi:hypothetical protein